MKLYILQETGEFRIAQDGEWFQDSNGNFIKSEGASLVRQKIFAMTEVEANEIYGAKITLGDKNSPFCRSAYIPIVRPKPKVKKWQWLFKRNDGLLDTTPLYKNEEEVLAYIECIYNGVYTCKVIRKLEESEVEVEE